MNLEEQIRAVALLREVYDATTKVSMTKYPNRLRLLRRRVFSFLQEQDK